MAWISAIVAAGAAYYQSQQQKKAAKKIGSAADRLYGIQADTAEALQPYAKEYYGRIGEGFNPAMAYYKALAGNDQTAIYGALAPQLEGIGNRYSNMLRASSELNPRSGASAAYNTDLMYRAGDERQALINSERSGAYGNLAKMAGLAADIGSGAAGGSTQAAMGAGGMFNNAGLMSMLGGGNSAQAYGDLAKSLFGDQGVFKHDSSGWYVGNQRGAG